MVMMNRGDLDFILQQIVIAEADARGEQLLGNLIPDPTLPWGLRRVDGSNNNLLPSKGEFGAADQTFPSLLPQQFRNEGDDRMLFGPPGTPAIPGQTLLTNNNYGVNAKNNPAITRGIQPGDVVDADPRIISNLVVDQSLQNPAAIYRALVLAGSADRMGDLATVTAAVDALEAAKVGGDPAAIEFAENSLLTALGNTGINVFNTTGDLSQATVDLPNVAPDEGLSPPFNSWMTLFGQFFDHGLDLVGKGGNGTVYVPLQPDDPLYRPGSPTNFMALTRATVDADGNATNKTTSWVDQNQTYTSNASAQVFHREYALVNGRPQATGRLLEGAGGGLATWADVKAQARNLLGVELNDLNVHAVPELLVDPYGNFLAGPNGFVQLVRSIDANGVVTAVEGSPDAPVRTADGFVSTGHAFLDDIAHNANPSAGKVADADTAISTASQPQPAGTYDNELLDRHFITGDGRGNENFGLTSVHYVFHSEHNRQVDLVKGLVLAEAVADPAANLPFLNEWLNTPITAADLATADAASLDWNGERLFQAGKFPTEMQYQHLVFEEFGRTIQPAINVFNAYNSDLDGSVVSEFADVVYRFGHSMMGESVDRFDQNFEVIGSDGVRGLNAQQVSLFEAFLNPVEWTELDGIDGGMSQAEAAAAVARGMTRQVGQEIDEFVVGDLRNRLVGVALDLAALNIGRGRERGVPSLNEARTQFFAGSQDSAIKPYASWCDLSLNLRNPASIVNVIAAYGTHNTIAAATTSEAKRDAAWDLVMGKPGDAAFNTDRLDFLNARGAYAADPELGGLNEVDFWVGGLLEKPMPFGGMLGTTFNFVFEVQMEKLQDTDRFYYLNRLANLNLTAQMENNKFAEIIHRNTTATHLPGNVFKAMDLQLEVDQAKQFNAGLGSADPQGSSNGLDPFLAAMTGDQKVLRADFDADGDNDLLQFVGPEHVVLGGTNESDVLIAGDGDDTLWGDDGDDNLEGGIGNDFIFGGLGDDIITDSFGIDEIRSGAGDDVVNGGPGFNLIITDTGSDVVFGANDDEEFLLGQGNDFSDGGDGIDMQIGGEGNDWIESGNGNGLMLGDNGDIVQGLPIKRSVTSPIVGHDVTYATGGNADHDAETGDDIMVGGLGTDKFFGALGFDWATHKDDPYGIYAEMNGRAFNVPLAANSPGAALDRYLQTEAVSGSAFNDIIRGAVAALGADEQLLDVNVSLINGLAELLAGVDEAGEIRFSAGDILIGGKGSDIFEGRGANDLIDGDRSLDVKIQVTPTTGSPYLVSRLAEVRDQLFSRELKPNQLSIWRSIVDQSVATDVDVVQYRGNFASYTIEGYNAITGIASDVDGDGWISITDNQANPTDGADRVKAVERALFNDGSVKIAEHANRMAEGRVDLFIDGEAAPVTNGVVTAAVGQVLLASAANVRDWDERSAANPLSAVTAPVEYTWQVETAAGSGVFTDILTNQLDNTAVVRGQTFAVTAAEAGLAIRVMGRFTDAAGAIETVFSNAQSINPNASPVVVPPIDVNGAISELVFNDPLANNFLHVESGSFAIVDPDFTNVQTVSVISSATTLADRTTPLGTLVPVVSDNTTGDGTGVISWTYEVSDTALNPLLENEQVVETFVLAINDGNGGITNQVVTVNLAGTRDPVNEPATATGLVVSDSTPTEDQALSVQGQNTISDPNGVPANPVFTYQWQQRLATSTDPNAWTNIAGATGVSFTPGQAQVNQAMRVQVSFTDGDGFSNTLFTAATGGTGDAIQGTAAAEILNGTAYSDTVNSGVSGVPVVQADTINSLGGDDTVVWNVGGGLDIVDGGTEDSLGDTFQINGDATIETYRIYSRAAYLALGGPLRTAAPTTEIVITRNGTNNVFKIAELREIEEIVINTSGQVTQNNGDGVLNGGQIGLDTVQIIGNFAGTSLNYSTITINGGEEGEAVDISALESAHRIHFRTGGGDDVVIGQLRPQDVIDIPADADPADYTATDNGDGTVTLASATHSVTYTGTLEASPQLHPAGPIPTVQLPGGGDDAAAEAGGEHEDGDGALVETPTAPGLAQGFDETAFKQEFGTDLSGVSFSASSVLKQAFSFNLADLSLLADKALIGDYRALSSLANNVVAPTAERSRDAIGTTPVDTVVTPVEEGSGDDQFVRITEVNNYPGPGNISQGVNGQPITGRLQLEGPDGVVLPNERVLSNALSDQGTTFMPEEGGWNNLFMGAGQYIDHGLDLLNKGGQGQFSIPLPEDDGLGGKVPGNALQLLPRGTSVDLDPGEGRYMNTVTGWIDQNQLYGSDAVIHGYLREKSDGVMTARMLNNAWSAPSADGAEGLPTFYDVLINNGASKAALDAVLNNPAYRAAHAALSAWDVKVRAGDPSVTGNPAADGMGQFIGMLTGSRAALMAAAGEAWVEPGGKLPESNQQLLGDASHLAGFDAISLAEHRIAGDLRVNENAQLAAFHTVFANFHNNTVEAIEAALETLPADAAGTPGLEQLAALKANLHSEEGQSVVFDMARQVLSAAYQRMVYDQYVVGLAGGIPFGTSADQDPALQPDPSRLMPQPINQNEHGYNGYQPEVCPSIALEFSTAGFRVGHSQIYEDLNGITTETVQGIVSVNDTITQSLIQAFIQPSSVNALGGPAGILAANAVERAQAVDTLMVNAVRNMLVGRANDLGAFNSARNNELGMPTLQEFRQNIYNLYQATGVGNALANRASDMSAGLYEFGGNEDLFLERVKPYETWKDFGDQLRDPALLEIFIKQFGGAEASEDNNIGLVNVPLWLGGLAEKEVVTPTGEGDLPSLMGSTFTFIVQETFDRVQDPDLHYYKIDIPGTDILKQLNFQTFTPLLQTSLGMSAQLIHQDTFRSFRLDVLQQGLESFEAPLDDADFDGRLFNRVIIGNAEDNTISGGDGSDDIRAGAGDDSVDAGKGADWVYGQAGSDHLSGGDDASMDHLFGGADNDVLVADNGSEDALFGETGDDVLIRGNTGGMSDGGLGHDVLLGGKGDDTLHGDSGAADATNPDGADIILGGKGDDEIKGGGGDDLLAGGESGVLGDAIYGDSIAERNAELLARAIRDDQGRIVSTLAPLHTGNAYGVTVGGVNPLNGQLFTAADLAEFRTYIEGLRQVPDPTDPGNRGPQPVMVVMPYTGPAGHDTIYTGDLADAYAALGATANLDDVLAWLGERDEEAAPEPHTEADFDAGQTAEDEDPAGVEAEAEAGPEAEGGALAAAAVDLVFAGGGDDTVYTDGEVSTQVFGGPGADKLVSGLRDDHQHLQIDSLNAWGAEGLVQGDSGLSDRFHGMESVVLDAAAQTSLSINQAEAPVTVDFNNAIWGRNVEVSTAQVGDQSLLVSNVDHFTLTTSSQDRIKLGGKLDYDGKLDANTTDDNYQILWDGQSLSISGRTTGVTSFTDAEWVEFNYQDVNNPSGGIKREFYYKEFAQKAINLGLSVVKQPVFEADQPSEMVLRQFGNAQERSSSFYLALTAESLRNSGISTLDFTVNLGETFAEVFELNADNIHFTDDLAVQRQVQVIDGPNGPSIRFAGAALEALGVGRSVTDQTVLAYVELNLRGDIDTLIKAERIADANGFLNQETFSVPLTFSVDANVDHVVWEDQFSLRDLGGQYAMLNPSLEVVARSAHADLSVEGGFDLGTQRQIVKPGEGSFSNLVRRGDTILQTNTWRNDGEFSLVDLRLDAISDAVAAVTAEFSTGGTALAQLGWNSEAGAGAAVDVTTRFTVTGEAGSVLDTTQVGYSLSADGDYGWITTEMEQFAVKHLVTHQGDLNYDGRVDMKDLAALNAGAASHQVPHDVDANYDGVLDMLDLTVLDADWGKSLHTGDSTFLGSAAISMAELHQQNGRSWDSSAFSDQNAIESGALQQDSLGHERSHAAELDDSAAGLISAAGLDQSVLNLLEDQQQQHALTTV